MPLLPKPKERQLFLYKCSFDGAWCRAQLLPNKQVLLVDFGSKEPFAEHKSKCFPKRLAHIPVLVRHCSLAKVFPSGVLWSEGCKKFIKDTCDDQELLVLVKSFLKKSPMQVNPCLEVEIFLKHTAVSLSDLLVQKGFAKHTEVSHCPMICNDLFSALIWSKSSPLSHICS